MDIQYNHNFLNFFTTEEMVEIVENSIVISDYTIIIMTNKYFFELSVGNKLDIYCREDEGGNEKQLQKDEFLHLLKNNSSIEVQHINIDN